LLHVFILFLCDVVITSLIGAFMWLIVKNANGYVVSGLYCYLSFNILFKAVVSDVITCHFV